MKKLFYNKNKVAQENNNQNFFSAFTLIEMVVSLGIIMIISVIFIANYRNSNKRTDLIMTAQSLVADIHAAQNNSLGLVRYSGEVPAGGWGVNFNKDDGTYTIFADLQAPHEAGSLEFNSDLEGDRDSGARKITFDGEIEIDEIKIFSGPGELIENTTNEANVTFLPPDPRIFIYNETTHATGTAITVKLKEVNGGGIRTVKINFLGLIEMID